MKVKLNTGKGNQGESSSKRESPQDFTINYRDWLEQTGRDVDTKNGTMIRPTPKAYAIIRKQERKEKNGS